MISFEKLLQATYFEGIANVTTVYQKWGVSDANTSLCIVFLYILYRIKEVSEAAFWKVEHLAPIVSNHTTSGNALLIPR